MNNLRTVILVKINHPDFSFHPPMGLMYIANSLKKNKFNVKIYHIASNKIENYVDEIIQMNPIFVGFSVFTGEAMRSYASMSRLIKKKSKIPVVWGNAHPSLMPEQCLGEDYIDYIVTGEGEITAVELARELEHGHGDMSHILGLGYKDLSGGIHVNDLRPFITNIDDYKPEWDLIDVEKYITPYFYDGKRSLPISTSRGCPHNCAFCYNKIFHDRKWRAHSAGYVISMVEELKRKYSIDSVIISDDNYFVNKKRAFDILEGIDMPSSCSTKSSYFDDEFASNLNKYKCRSVLLGMESGSEHILKSIRKESDTKDNINAVKLLSKYQNINVTGSFILGFPMETKEEGLETLNFMISLFGIKKQIRYTLGMFLPYPGSDLFAISVEKGFKPPVRTEDWEDFDRWTSKTGIDWGINWISSIQISRLRNIFMIMSICRRRNFIFSNFLYGYLKAKVACLKIDGIFVSILILLFSKPVKYYMFFKNAFMSR